MKIKVLALLILTLFITLSAHAESYNFSDNTAFTTADYVENSGTPAAVLSHSLNISGTTGQISDLNVTLSGIYSTALIDMTFVLVGPNNTGIVLASHAGGGSAGWTHSPAILNNVDLTFDDSASSEIGVSTGVYDALRKSVVSGSYQTSAYLEVPQWHQQYTAQVALMNPAAAGIFGGVDFAETNLLSAFNDISANGTWNLLAYDNLSYNQTTVNGWSLSITTSPVTAEAVPEPAEWLLIGLCACGIIMLKYRPHKSGLKVLR